ncbi:MAG: alpha/beta fold hydrolase [Polyangiales bacterium]
MLGWRYDWLTQPEVAGEPNSASIRVFYYANWDWQRERPSCHKASHRRPALLYFNGGPGQSSHADVDIIHEFLDASARLVFMDQRGTGCSSPYPPPGDKDQIERLTNWGADAIVRDAQAIRGAVLGNDPWDKVLGVSYGSIIAHRYLADAPQGVREVHAALYPGSVEAQTALQETASFQQQQWLQLQTRFGNTDAQRMRERWQEIAAQTRTSDDCLEGTVHRLCGAWFLHAYHTNIEKLRTVLISDLTTLRGSVMLEAAALDRMIDFLAISGLSETSHARAALMRLERRLRFVDRHANALAWLVLMHIDANAELLPHLQAQHTTDQRTVDTTQGPSALAYYASLQPVLEDIDHAAITALPAEPRSWDTLKAALREENRLFLYAGALDGVAPPTIFQPEVDALKGTPGFHYQVWPGVAHDLPQADSPDGNELRQRLTGRDSAP